jgi:hypothetical protein
MARQQIERLDFEDQSRMMYLRMDREAGSCSDAGLYFKFCERCRHMAAAITRTVADAIRPPDHFFGAYATAAPFTPADLRFAWVGIMAGIAGLATLLILGWSEIGAGTVSATERRADPSNLAAARGVAAPAPLPTPPAASKPAEAKERHAVKERPARGGHARRASKYRSDRIRVVQAKDLQVAREPQAIAASRPQADQAPPEENKAFGWVRRLPDAIVPSSWMGGWENLWAKGNGGGGSSCSPSANPATACPREAHAGAQ